MENLDNKSIDEVLKYIREAIVEKEKRQYFRTFYPQKNLAEGEVFVLSKNMLVKREDIPYSMGVWSFDDVAKKIMKKYRNYFNLRPEKNTDDRVRVKGNNFA